MALIKCHECNAEISSEAKLCPKCGVPLKNRPKKEELTPKQKKYTAIISIIVVIVFAPMFMGEDKFRNMSHSSISIHVRENIKSPIIGKIKPGEEISTKESTRSPKGPLRVTFNEKDAYVFSKMLRKPVQNVSTTCRKDYNCITKEYKILVQMLCEKSIQKRFPTYTPEPASQDDMTTVWVNKPSGFFAISDFGTAKTQTGSIVQAVSYCEFDSITEKIRHIDVMQPEQYKKNYKMRSM